MSSINFKELSVAERLRVLAERVEDMGDSFDWSDGNRCVAAVARGMFGEGLPRYTAALAVDGIGLTDRDAYSLYIAIVNRLDISEEFIDFSDGKSESLYTGQSGADNAARIINKLADKYERQGQ